jgi:hypothetical protein
MRSPIVQIIPRRFRNCRLSDEVRNGARGQQYFGAISGTQARSRSHRYLTVKIDETKDVLREHYVMLTQDIFARTGMPTMDVALLAEIRTRGRPSSLVALASGR